jgi:hypothetical protein
VVTLPAKAVACMSELELTQVVNFARITPPTLKKATIELKFKKAAEDTVMWKGSITLGAGIAFEGIPVTVDVGGATQTFVLNKKGKAKNGGGNKFAFDAELKNGVTKAGPVNFTFNLKGDFKALFADYGLVDGAFKNVPVTVPVTLTAGPGHFTAAQAFTYSTKQGKSGTAKAP